MSPMKAKLIIDRRTPYRSDEFPDGVVPAGSVIDHPKAYMLVRMGVAEPADDECRLRAGLSESKMFAAQHAARRTRAGIIPDDFTLFDAGEISGYNPDGSYKPGPKATEDLDLAELEDTFESFEPDPEPELDLSPTD